LMKVRPIGYLIIKFVSYKLKIDERKSLTIEDHVKFSFSWRFLNLLTIRPSQISEEMNQLLALIGKMRPKIVLEIGTGMGGSLYLLSKIATANATLISVDLPIRAPSWKIQLYRAFAKDPQRIHVLQGDSHTALVLSKIKKVINEDRVDFLFIDGDHSYEGIRRDFEMYAPLVRDYGVIAFHDIVAGSPASVGDVPRFWSEIKHNYRYMEIIRSRKQGGLGIGVMFMQKKAKRNS
jgi:predicted O-methyltransferase YrrM